MATGKPTETMGETFLIFMVHPTLTEENMPWRSNPGVAHEDIAACLNYAGEILRTERVYALNACLRKK